MGKKGLYSRIASDQSSINKVAEGRWYTEDPDTHPVQVS